MINVAGAVRGAVGGLILPQRGLCCREDMEAADALAQNLWQKWLKMLLYIAL